MSPETMTVLALYIGNCSFFIYAKDLRCIFIFNEFLMLFMLFSRVCYKTAVYVLK